MKISKYKKGSNGIYKVVLEDGRTLSLYEDVILKFNFLIVSDIDEKTIIEAEKYNQECDVYYVALKSIRSRLRSSYELQRFLLHKQYPANLIDKAIRKLEKQGYLNDQLFARSYIYHQMITTNKGPLKIEKELLEKKVSNDIINDANFAAIDVSFISVTKIIEKFKELPNLKEVVCLIKPQFECGAEIATKFKGVIKDESVRQDVIKKVVLAFEEIGYNNKGVCESPIKGGDGNIEFLGYFIK